VLTRQHLRRRHDRRLVPRLDRDQAGVQRNQGLAGTDVALQQDVHRLGRLHAAIDLRHRADLRIGRHERQRPPERRRQRALGGV
jgi:hypothetical protein